MNLTTNELIEIYRKELASAKLVELPEEFYSEVIKLLAKLRLEIKRAEEIKQEILKEELKEAIFYLNELYRVRVIKAMHELALGNLPDNVLENERNSFLEVKQTLENLRREFLIGATDAELPILIPSETTRTLVTFIADLNEKISGVDSKIYGPFKCGDIANLPASTAEMMVKHGYARRIEVDHEF